MNKSEEYKIKNRNNILLWVLIFIIIIAIVIGIFIDKITIDLSNISLSDIMALIISLWSMYISVLFYHKNNETNTIFYDNFYKFIKDVTEKIGKLDVGVNEKLNYIKDNYNKDIPEELKEELNNYKTQEKEKQNIIDDLIHKSDMDEVEKRKLSEKLMYLDNELKRKNMAIHNTKEELITNNPNIAQFFEYLSRDFPKKTLRRLANGDRSLSLLDKYNDFISVVPRRVISLLRNYNIINSDNILTLEGYDLLILFTENNN